MASEEQAAVVAVLVSYNTRDLLLEAISSVLAQDEDVQVVVVDNASSDGSADAVEARFGGRVRVVRSPVNLGFAAGVNRGAQVMAAGDLLLLNPDAALAPGALAALRALLAVQPRAAAVGAALRYADGRPQASAFRFPGLAQVALDLFPVPRLAGSRLNGRYPARATPFQVDHPLGACLLIRRQAWGQVGPLDEGYFMYVEEVDWCRRARAAGWEVWHEPRAVAVHHAGQATRQQVRAMFLALWRSRLRYYRRHHGPLMNATVRALVRLGMRAERRRAWRAGDAERAEAAEAVRRLARGAGGRG